MKLLFDQNLAPGLVHRLTNLYPNSAHVFQLGLGEADDLTLWSYARDHDFVIVSKDSDFHQLSVLHGPPPKVIWVRLGNCSVDDVERALREHHDVLSDFGSTLEAFLVLGVPI